MHLPSVELQIDYHLDYVFQFTSWAFLFLYSWSFVIICLSMWD